VKTISRAAEVGRGSRRLTPSRVVPDQVPSTKGPHGRSRSVERNGPSPSRGSGRGDTWNKRVTNEELVEAYRATGSIWKAAKRLGLCGQSVHERLRRLGYEMTHQVWTLEEVKEARSLANQGEPLGQIANRIGRTYSAVALKLSRLGVGIQKKSGKWKPKRGVILSKERVAKFALMLERGTATVRRLARQEGVAITPLVDALQFFEPQRWRNYVRSHSRLAPVNCPGCQLQFVPLTKKQQFCTVRCRQAHWRNVDYFGGRRMEALGLREGVCQLCFGKFDKWLSAHHVLGKERDPENKLLIALCRGCHDMVTNLAARPWVENSESAADLISLALARRGRLGAVVCLEIEEWREDEQRDYIDAGRAE